LLVLNSHPDHGLPLLAEDAELLRCENALVAQRFFSTLPRFRASPLVSLAGLAREQGLAALHVKDESDRLGLQSFKALGGLYAVARLVLERAEAALGHTLEPADLRSGAVRAVAAGITFACATDGNHGRSVAAGAQLTGAHARIFVHPGISAPRLAALTDLGAQLVRVPGRYDDAVAQAEREAARHGWLLLSDTSWPGYERVPGMVMQGYTVLLREALAQLPRPPTHVFVQAGVGGLAAALAGYLAGCLAGQRPLLVVVEPSRAACLLASARAHTLVRTAPGRPTLMAMLECFTPSLLAWRILCRSADAFMTVDEGDAILALRRLARPLAGDPALIAGESGGAGLAGLLRAAADRNMRAALGLNAQSRVLLVNTEGATDPPRYRQLLGPGPALAQQPLLATLPLKGIT
jgi:diaminopropionate ammonia-lyase